MLSVFMFNAESRDLQNLYNEKIKQVRNSSESTNFIATGEGMRFLCDCLNIAVADGRRVYDWQQMEPSKTLEFQLGPVLY